MNTHIHTYMHASKLLLLLLHPRSASLPPVLSSLDSAISFHLVPIPSYSVVLYLQGGTVSQNDRGQSTHACHVGSIRQTSLPPAEDRPASPARPPGCGQPRERGRRDDNRPRISSSTLHHAGNKTEKDGTAQRPQHITA